MNWLWRDLSPSSNIHFSQNYPFLGSQDEMEFTPDGCKDDFLNGVIKEEVYIEQTQWFESHDRNTHVCILKKSLYGLKRVPRAWYGRIDGFLMSLGFTKSKADSNLYYKVVDDMLMILFLYVDDLFLIGEYKLISECKKNLVTKFEMKDLGMMHYFLGLEVWKFLDEIFLSQGKYVVEILKIFGSMNCKAMSTPIVTNLKLLNDDSLETIDVTLYK